MTILKKPAILLSSYSSIQSWCHCSHAQSSTSSPQTSIQPSRQQRRKYATVHDGPPIQDADAHPWPTAKPPHSLPTPYQILALKKGSPYCKDRFYELVKLYHPDRTGHTHHIPPQIRDIPHPVRLERYRLIVAAHTILYDPIKRSAYDRYGAGWNGHPEVGGPSFERRGEYRPGSDPMANATWEDWERWYHSNGSQDRPPQSPMYLSNMAFMSLIVMFAALGGIGQATRASQSSLSFIEQRDAMHNQTSKELRRVRQETREQGSKNERIQTFLRNRDATFAEEEYVARRLPVQEVCSSAELAGRDMALYHHGQGEHG